jgi:hypothetical protein
MTWVDTVQTVQPVPVLVEDSVKNVAPLAKSHGETKHGRSVGVKKDPLLQDDIVMNDDAVVDGTVVDGGKLEVSVCSRSVLFVVLPRCTTHSCPL